MASYDWMLGVGMMFGLAIVLGYALQIRNIAGFFVLLMIFDGFMVYMGLLDSWTFYLLLSITIVLIYNEVMRNKG